MVVILYIHTINLLCVCLFSASAISDQGTEAAPVAGKARDGGVQQKGSGPLGRRASPGESPGGGETTASEGHGGHEGAGGETKRSGMDALSSCFILNHYQGFTSYSFVDVFIFFVNSHEIVVVRSRSHICFIIRIH